MTGIQCAECGRFCGEADFALGHCEYTPETEFGHERIEWLCRRCSPTKVTRLTKADEETVSRILDEEGDDWERSLWRSELRHMSEGGMTGFDVYERLARLNGAHKRDVARWTEQYLRSKAIADRSAPAPRRETGVARKGESGGASAIAQGQIT